MTNEGEENRKKLNEIGISSNIVSIDHIEKGGEIEDKLSEPILYANLENFDIKKFQEILMWRYDGDRGHD